MNASQGFVNNRNVDSPVRFRTRSGLGQYTQNIPAAVLLADSARDQGSRNLNAAPARSRTMAVMVRNTSRNTPPSKWDEEAPCVENGD
jgi:hypothetical protein